MLDRGIYSYERYIPHMINHRPQRGGAMEVTPPIQSDDITRQRGARFILTSPALRLPVADRHKGAEI